MKVKRPLNEMQALAGEVVEILRPYCDRIEVAGSIRRHKAEVGDIEVVAVPRLNYDMFGDTRDGSTQVDDFLHYASQSPLRLALRDDGKPVSNGSKAKKLVYQGVQVDLFLQPDPGTWGVNFMIRTGSADFVHKMMTPKAFGGYKPAGFQTNGALLYIGGVLAHTPEEEDVFRLWDMDFVPPTEREA